MVLRSKVVKRNAFSLLDVNDRRQQLENPALGRTPAKPCQDMQWISKWLIFTWRNLNSKFTVPHTPHGATDNDFHHRRRGILSWQEQMSAFHEHLMFVSLIKEWFFSDTWWNVWKKVVGLCEASDKIPLFVYLISCLSCYPYSPFSTVCLKLCPWGHTKGPL